MPKTKTSSSRHGGWAEGKNGEAAPEDVSQTTTTVTSLTTQQTGVVDGNEMPQWEQPSEVPVKQKTKKSKRKKNKEAQAVVDQPPQSPPPKARITSKPSPQSSPVSNGNHPFENMVVTFDDGSNASINYDEITVDGSLGHPEDQHYFSHNQQQQQQQHYHNHRSPVGTDRKISSRSTGHNSTAQEQQSPPPKSFVWKRGPNGRFVKVPKLPVGLDQVEEEETIQQQERTTKQEVSLDDMQGQMKDLSIQDSQHPESTNSQQDEASLDYVVEASRYSRDHHDGGHDEAEEEEEQHHTNDEASSRYSQRYEPELRRDDEYYRDHPYTPDYVHYPANYGCQQFELDIQDDHVDSSTGERWKVERSTSGLSALSNNSYGSRASNNPRIGFFHLPDMGESFSETTNSEASSIRSSGTAAKNFEWKRGPNGRFIKVPIGG